MMLETKIHTFEDAVRIAQKNVTNKFCTKDIRILLGNGFSQAYHKDFSYTTLFAVIKDKKEYVKIKKLFDYLSTSNFEAVLSFLKNAQFLFKTYGIKNSSVKKDYEKLRDALAETIVKVHPKKTSVIPDENKKTCYDFLRFFSDIYTVNYDLLLYWALLTDPSLEFGDYFNRDEDTPDQYCEYIPDGAKKKKHVYFLHGGVHLFLKDGRTIKKVWGNTIPLIAQIKQEIENGYYPWVVAEGDYKAKLEQIKSNPYLDRSYLKLSQNGGQLFTFGFSFSEPDTHIINAIVRNASLRFLWIGIRGNFDEEKNKKLIKLTTKMIRERSGIVGRNNGSKFGPLEINFYNAGDLDIWGVNKKAGLPLAGATMTQRARKDG